VTALKDEPGGSIALSGSVSVVRQLLAAGFSARVPEKPLRMTTLVVASNAEYPGAIRRCTS